ncbi:MAG: sugar ABC transporter permease [bacterium]|nr:sugar ABC transporter permease [bacterium]
MKAISARRNTLYGLLFALPWIIGFLAFTAYPILASLYYSLTEFVGIGIPKWIGSGNYKALMNDELFWKSLYNTIYYVGLAVPIGFVVGLGLALLLNMDLKEVGIYRTLVYIPYVLPAVVVGFIWLWMLNPYFGLLNLFLNTVFHIQGPGWFSDPKWAKPAFVMLAQWGAGGSAVIFLAAIKDVPRELLESAEIDGAGWWTKFSKIIIPMISPVILYHIITALFGGFQIFTTAYIATNGGPANSTLFYVLYLYRSAFQYSKMGYASAMAWILFILVLILTLIIFRTSARWVFYRGGGE